MHIKLLDNIHRQKNVLLQSYVGERKNKTDKYRIYSNKRPTSTKRSNKRPTLMAKKVVPPTHSVSLLDIEDAAHETLLRFTLLTMRLR